MSLATDGFDVAVQDAYAFFGDAARYVTRDAEPAQVTVLLDDDLSSYGGTAVVIGKTMMVSVRASQVPALPRRGDVFEVLTGKYAGRRLVVDSAMESDALEHKVLAA